MCGINEEDPALSFNTDQASAACVVVAGRLCGWTRGVVVSICYICAIICLG